MAEKKLDYVMEIIDTKDGFVTIVDRHGTERIIPKRAIIRIERNQTYGWGPNPHSHVYVDDNIVDV